MEWNKCTTVIIITCKPIWTSWSHLLTYKCLILAGESEADVSVSGGEISVSRFNLSCPSLGAEGKGIVGDDPKLLKQDPQMLANHWLYYLLMYYKSLLLRKPMNKLQLSNKRPRWLFWWTESQAADTEERGRQRCIQSRQNRRGVQPLHRSPGHRPKQYFHQL